VNGGSRPGRAGQATTITRAIAAANTFHVVADEYLAKIEREGRTL